MRVEKFTTLVLLFFLVIRHSMYYFDIGFIRTEFGFDQSFIGIFLIPVTTAFGFLLFWHSGQILVSNKRIVRFSIIFIIPFIINFVLGNSLDSIFYNYDDCITKAPFLILIPISLSFFICLTKSRILILILIFIFFMLNKYFIFQMASLFLLFYLLKSFLLPIIEKHTFFNFLSYLLLSLLVISNSIENVNYFHMFFLTLFFVSSIRSFSIFICKVCPISLTSILDYNTLHFYIIQGLIYNLFTDVISDILKYILVILIFILSLLFSRITYSLENMFFKFAKIH
jgi:hypothetical protein